MRSAFLDSGTDNRSLTRIRLLETAVVVYSLAGAAFRTDRPSIFADPEGLLRLAIPAAAAMIVLWLRDRTADPASRPPHAAAVDVIAVFLAELASQILLSLAGPGLTLPRWAPTQGGFVGGVGLLTLCRALSGAGLIGRPASLPRIGLWSAAAMLTGVALWRVGSTVYPYWIPLAVWIACEAFQKEKRAISVPVRGSR